MKAFSWWIIDKNRFDFSLCAENTGKWKLARIWNKNWQQKTKCPKDIVAKSSKLVPYIEHTLLEYNTFEQ